jgi:hypothetical protein
MVKIISISLTDEEKAWIDFNNVSPTALFKQKLQDYMIDSAHYRNKIKELMEIIEIQKKESTGLIETIEIYKHLIENYKKDNEKNANRG